MKSIIYSFFLSFFFFGTSSSVLAQLTEGFEGNFPPEGWVLFDNGVQQEQSWEIATKNPNNGSAHAFVNFSTSRSAFAEDWLVTPKLLPSGANNVLTFQATNDFEGNTGSVYTVRVSTTSQSDHSSFTIISTLTETDFTPKVYKSFSVDLSAYIGQEIYVAFVLENSRGDSFLLDDVSAPPTATVANVPNCDAMLTQPDPKIWNEVPVDITLGWTPASGDPTGYKISIGTSQEGSQFLALTDIGNTTNYQPMTDFAFDTRYYVTIVAYNGNGDAANCQEFEFTTQMPISTALDCSLNSETNKKLCYGNNGTESFNLSANNSNQVNLTFNGGTLENNQDEISIYDGTDNTGRLLNETKLFGNAGDLIDLSYTSTTGNLFVEITSDGSNSCESGEQTEIDYTASCTSCVSPIASVAEGNCDANNAQFFIDLNVTSLGNGTLTLGNDQNENTQNITSLGTTTIGPFNFGTVRLSLLNSNNLCAVELPAITSFGCAPTNDDCATALALSLSTYNICEYQVTGNNILATTSSVSGLCTSESLDIWYSFTANSTASHTFELSNVQSLQSVAVYEGDCNSELILIGECNNEVRSNVELISGETYLIQVAADEQIAGTFDLCVFLTPPAPLNDLCANAIVIPCPAGLNSSGIDITYATNTGMATCNDNLFGAGVWYQVVGTGGTLSITANPNGWDSQIQLWSGTDCNDLTCETSTNAGIIDEVEMITNFVTMANTTYYIYLGAATNGELTGTIDLTISCTDPSAANISCLDNPLNDPCNNISINDGKVNQDVEACHTIATTESSVTIETNKTVVFKAGVSITLKPGFIVESGADFHALIEPCSSNLHKNETTLKKTSSQ